MKEIKNVSMSLTLDSVLIGEYKRLDRYIDGAIALQKRNGDDFFLRYHAQGILNLNPTLSIN